MKKVLLFACLALCSAGFAQTSLLLAEAGDKVSQWLVLVNGDTLGHAYSIEGCGKVRVEFAPKTTPKGVLVVTGTYTSTTGKVAKIAYDENCAPTGDPNDKFQPNAYLVFGRHLDFSPTANCNAIPVYQLLDRNKIDTGKVSKLTTKHFTWRFMVKKSWTKTFDDGSVTAMSDWLVVDLEEPMSIFDACLIIQGLSRENEQFKGFTLSTEVSACLLDTGSMRPFIYNGQNMFGAFPAKQSNVIVVE
jgi:hypothetical protein